MSLLYRCALTVTPKQPYIDWTNNADTDDAVVDRLERVAATIYLAPTVDHRPSLIGIVGEFWKQIFEEQLVAWMEDDRTWPEPRTREMFDDWFNVELTDTVIDLAPDTPLTESDFELAALSYTLHHCAWCDIEVEPEAGRNIAFRLTDREPLAAREGLTVEVPLRSGDSVFGIMSPGDSDQAAAGEDLVFRACTSRCEKAIRKEVPRGLRRLRAR